MGDCHEEMSCPNAQIIKNGPCLDRTQQLALIDEVSKEEILEEVTKMPKDKTAGVDGYPIEFYTKNWDMVKEDISQVWGSIAPLATPTSKYWTMGPRTGVDLSQGKVEKWHG
ncbi:hypothetical protein H5410_015920 [Solanum commersonii]|uniref:Uncharacterized protein n=1 Tax=Solanum commersonii TaxID=4109 RepID=A0A9J5ZV63_SOLCO|nr:hypothetical protein H5410_015920 [Solanum commersonii]